MTDKTLAPVLSSDPAMSGASGVGNDPGAGAETVRDLAQAIANGSPFVDADAILVARAYLDSGGETA